jgi:DNA-binding NarL/FixJ family response regulator
MKIILVDDNKLFREGIKYCIRECTDWQVIAEAGDGMDFLSLKNIREADIILMDIEMPYLNGFQTTKIALNDYPGMKIIAVTMYEDRMYLQQLIESGFRGAIFKPDIYNKLIGTINHVYKGKMNFPEDIKITKN